MKCNFICKECGKLFSSYNKNAKYCSKTCSLINTKTNLKNKSFKNIAGQKYGKLTVLNLAYMKKHSSYWNCLCECGNKKIVSLNHLTGGNCRSCGCIRLEASVNNCKSNEKLIKYREENFANGTNLASLKSKKSKNNTSGVKGVCWAKTNKKWSAYININKQNIRLGYFKNKQDAINARKEAEEKYFKPILDKYNKKD